MMELATRWVAGIVIYSCQSDLIWPSPAADFASDTKLLATFLLCNQRDWFVSSNDLSIKEHHTSSLLREKRTKFWKDLNIRPHFPSQRRVLSHTGRSTFPVLLGFGFWSYSLSAKEDLSAISILSIGTLQLFYRFSNRTSKISSCFAKNHLQQAIFASH